MKWRKVEDGFWESHDGQAIVYRINLEYTESPSWVLDIDGTETQFFFYYEQDAKKAYDIYLWTGKLTDDTGKII